MSPVAAIAVVVVALVAGAVSYAWLREMRVVRERQFALEERRLALEEQRQAASEEMPEMPLDLVMRCNAETEIWAREQMRSVVSQLWVKHKNWDGVRTEMAALDAAAIALEMGWSQTNAVS